MDKTKERTVVEKKDLITRLNRIEGQVRGVKKMVEEERYCMDIITQVMAVTAALNSFNKKLLNEHLHTCVVNDIRAGDTEVVDELCETIQKLMK
ncbi:DNA-binding FrmR family transcriptional regulator [Lachnospiraceae bacterium PF1-21]|uniref:Metal-sensing transcriptional repressor n=1 Tax=Ohessyouella blattaphilus TaxID=2949333 RepID=A0ABT1EDV0_9FIRM|nr:metal-sensing transcriptional repressor [Ohessyouella blattaphilus]MCP1108679.1 metal-sensing transcriptional repressor [Ohessyouella blattaphilus]MCR8562073.1 metal-sensing transcriptional repressor [Ohessyouella blattaphilus]MDL2249422.1 metal-sensing transcriptional repressor [Lachnospiraceae bacterium OttesenSCG-928-J05]